MNGDTLGTVFVAVVVGVVIGLFSLEPSSAWACRGRWLVVIRRCTVAGACPHRRRGEHAAREPVEWAGIIDRSRPRRRHGGVDDTWFSTQQGGWGTGSLGGSFGGGDSFSGGGAISEEEAPVETGKRLALTDEERAGIAAAVQTAEQETSAEIVPMIVGQSGLYREAHHRAGLLVAALVLTALLTMDSLWLPWGWHAANAVWLVGAAMVAYACGSWLGRWPPVLRLFTSRERMRHKVQLRAERAFANRGCRAHAIGPAYY